MISSPALPQSDTPKIVATLVEKLTGESSLVFTTSVSAYIVPGQGLQVNESGTNLLMNASFESGLDGWAGNGESQIFTDSGSACSGSGFLLIAYDPAGSGAVTSLATGGISSSSIIPGDPYTFSVSLSGANPQQSVTSGWQFPATSPLRLLQVHSRQRPSGNGSASPPCWLPEKVGWRLAFTGPVVAPLQISILTRHSWRGKPVDALF